MKKDLKLIACYQLDYDTSCPVNSIEEPELSVLYISRYFQGKGLDYKFLAHAEQEVTKNNALDLWLTAYYQNQNVVDFYYRQNYNLVGKCFF
ncbi:N-acetyltransferase [Labilibaculum antarcticum]|uniref:N-acetyltransferase n=1 Tax=Labilibaculum antarcticum TaxID=1717717 RepID=A0A1Y1CKS1_9BACT|nr:N-acetyltransferase [Labilibaculum antarcticum]